MGLGTNRDYKTRDNAATINLKLHKILMKRHIAAGLNTETASKIALCELMEIPYKKRKSFIDAEKD